MVGLNRNLRASKKIQSIMGVEILDAVYWSRLRDIKAFLYAPHIQRAKGTVNWKNKKLNTALGWLLLNTLHWYFVP